MGLFSNLFGGSSAPRGFYKLSILAITQLTSDTVKIEFDIPEKLKSTFGFKPGQYINVSISIDGKEERRSYSICSGKNEALAVAVKQVPQGKVSTWLTSTAKSGDEILVSKPEGIFTRDIDAKNVVAFAAGSGITPIMAIAKDLETTEDARLNLFFGNRSEASTIFYDEINQLKNTTPTFYLSGETKDGFKSGRIDKNVISEIIKSDLNILKADAFFICGPEQMIIDCADTLKLFGVSDSKIFFELFTEPVLMKPKTQGSENTYEGISHVSVILDGDTEDFDLDGSKSILEAAIDHGIDAPYSCKGGVCSSCKAKIIEGKATMKLNYALTDKDVEEGYILTCQAHPASETLTISFDEA